ncbi:MAG: patatin-like phospholipase family protein [Bacteroidetes bacterium]|nr:patatin-like phospholipase family protein [Bacteroidota bacterium]
MKLIKILSIDGGGIRGILPGQILISLEKKLQQKSGNSNARISDFFDLIAGTSTGGILSILYNAPDISSASVTKAKFAAEEAVDLYLKNGSAIFNRSFLKEVESFDGILGEKFDASPLEENLKKYFDDLKLSQCLKHCIITAYDIQARTPFFFRQRKAKENPDYNFLLRQVARSTSAAPTYFEPSLAQSFAGNKFPLVDGGVFANNPTLCAYAEARQIFESGIEERKKRGKKMASASEMFILSVGTGTVKVPYEYDKAKNWGLAGWARPVIDIMMSGVSDTVDFQLQQIFDAVGYPENYIRLMPDLAGASEDMSNASSENLLALKNAGLKSAGEFDSELERAADILCESKTASPNA